jgi:HSP20 family protein
MARRPVDEPIQRRILFLPAAESFQETCWRPAVDVYRFPDGWLAKFDLAGVRAGDYEVRIRGCQLTVSGTRRDSVLEQGCEHFSMEISYSRFERTIDLPCQLDPDRVTIDHRDGMLLIRLHLSRRPGP